MYGFLLALHSIVRWVLLLLLILIICRSWYALKRDGAYTFMDLLYRKSIAIAAVVQLLFGLTLYYVSPLVKYFLTNFPQSIHLREFRFFGMEHSTMMLIALSFILIASVRAGRTTTDRKKHHILAVWFTLVFIIIFLSIPWPFSPFTARPYFRLI